MKSPCSYSLTALSKFDHNQRILNMRPSQRFYKASKSVVIISDRNDPSAFCSGCVLLNNKSVSVGRVLVICPTQFINGRRQMLQVRFFDKKKLPATVLREHGTFSLLSTPRHNGCVGITWSEEAVYPKNVFMFVPKSLNKNQRKDACLAVESVEAYAGSVGSMEVGSNDYFMVLCDYSVENVGGVNRLAATPVFTKSGNSLGLVLQNCREGSGVEMKVVMKSSAVKPIIRLLNP